MPASQLTRRSLLKGLGLAALAGAAGPSLAACSGSGPAAGGGGGNGPLSFLTWDTDSESPLYTVAQDWAKAESTTVDLQSIPGGDEYEAKLRTVLASGAPPDSIRINDDFVKGYYAEGSLLDLREYMEKDGINPDDYYSVAFNFPKQPDGAHAAWPIMTNPGVIYINTDAFAEAGVELPPKNWSDEGWTWDDFLAAAQKLNIPGERYGCMVFPDTALETVWPVNNGSDGIYSKDGTRFTLAEPPATDAIQWVADLALKHKVHPDFATITAGENTPNWALSQLATGKVAMMLGLTSGIPYLRKNAKVKFDIVPTPKKVTRKTVNTMTVLAIPKESKNPDRAWSFLKYAVGPEASEVLATSRGFMPVSKSASKLFVPDDQGPANLALVSQALENAVNENFSEYIQQARSIYRPVLDTVWSGQQTAAEALGGVAQKVNDVLAGNG
jgi:multiple sugar transport system substrate-binding protein